MTTNSNKADKRSAILQVTLELIAEKGFHGAPTSVIAQRAGVGVGTIYRYFKDKDDLIHEVFNRLEENFQKAIIRGYNSAVPIREQYICYVTNIVHYFIDNPKQFKFIEQYYNSPYGIPKRRETLLSDSLEDSKKDPFRKLFEVGIKEQIIKDYSLPVLFALTIGPIVFMVRDYHTGFLELDEATILNTVESSWDALKR